MIVAVYNLNVGFLMHLSLEIPHVIQSHIWKKGWGRNRGGGAGTRDEMSVVQLQTDSPVGQMERFGGRRVGGVRQKTSTL